MARNRYWIDLFFFDSFPRSCMRYLYADAIAVHRCLNDDCTIAVMLVYDSDDVYASYINETYFVYLRCPRCGYRVKLGIPASFLQDVLRRQAKAFAEHLKHDPVLLKHFCTAWRDACKSDGR